MAGSNDTFLIIIPVVVAILAFAVAVALGATALRHAKRQTDADVAFHDVQQRQMMLATPGQDAGGAQVPPAAPSAPAPVDYTWLYRVALAILLIALAALWFAVAQNQKKVTQTTRADIADCNLQLEAPIIGESDGAVSIALYGDGAKCDAEAQLYTPGKGASSNEQTSTTTSDKSAGMKVLSPGPDLECKGCGHDHVWQWFIPTSGKTLPVAAVVRDVAAKGNDGKGNDGPVKAMLMLSLHPTAPQPVFLAALNLWAPIALFLLGLFRGISELFGNKDSITLPTWPKSGSG